MYIQPASTTEPVPGMDRVVRSRAADTADAKLGQRIRQLRRLRALSQSDVASVLGVTYQQVQKYETGKTRLPARLIPTLATLLEVDNALLLVGLQDDVAAAPAQPAPSEPDAKDVAELMTAFTAMRHPRSRRRLLSIVKAFAAEAGAGIEP